MVAARSRRHVLGLRDELREPPFPVEPFERMYAAILEHDPEALATLRSCRDEDLVGSSHGHDSRGLMNRDAASSPTIHLTDMHARADAKAFACSVASIASRSGGAGGAVEGATCRRRSSSPRGLEPFDSAWPPECAERSARQRHLELCSSRRRVHEIVKSVARTGCGCQSESRPRADAFLDLDTRLVTHRVAVMTRWDVEEVAQPGEPRPVRKVVPSLKTTNPTCRAWHHSPPTVGRTYRPAPARRDELPDGQVTELDDSGPDERELDDVVWSLEALGESVRHAVLTRAHRVADVRDRTIA